MKVSPIEIILWKPLFLITTFWPLKKLVSWLSEDHESFWEISQIWIPVLALAWYFGVLSLIVAWLVSWGTFRFYLFYLSETGDHLCVQDGWTRNCVDGFFCIMRGVLGLYDGYHDIHHKYPAIPWFRLKEASQKKKRYNLRGFLEELKKALNSI